MRPSNQINTQENVLSFAYAEIDDDSVVVLDRSTLERFALCPAQARLIDSGRVNNHSMIAAAGEAVHQAFSAAVTEYIQDFSLPHWEIAETALSALRSARPDIQPEALAAGRGTIRAWARWLSTIHYRNILRYDGGEGGRSGQLSADLPMGDLTLRITSELDLLCATESHEVVREIDYKSGWKKWGIEAIATSFQFGMHAWLIFQNYPDVQAVQVRVWNCRTNDLSYPVLFDRKREQELEIRIHSAAGYYVLYRNSDVSAVPVWPAIDKCSICSAAALCPASLHAGDLIRDPAGYVDLMVARAAKLAEMEKFAARYVDQTGVDILSPTGAAFGVNKPKQNRKPTKALYSVKTKGESDDGSESQER